MGKLPDIDEWVKEASQKGIDRIKEILSEQYNGLTIERIAEIAKAQEITDSEGLTLLQWKTKYYDLLRENTFLKQK